MNYYQTAVEAAQRGISVQDTLWFMEAATGTLPGEAYGLVAFGWAQGVLSLAEQSRIERHMAFQKRIEEAVEHYRSAGGSTKTAEATLRDLAESLKRQD